MLNQKEFEKQFMELYETGISTTEICEKLGENRNRGYSLLRRKQLSSNPLSSKIYTKEVIDILEAEYLSGATIEELQVKYPEYAGNMNNYLRKRGVTRRRGNISNCNPHYFKNIDTPQKAYFLGLLMADGCITEKKRNPNNKTLRIELCIEDKYILEEFARALDSTLTVKESFGNGKPYEVGGKIYYNNKHECYFSLGCIELIEDLMQYGCVPRKSKILKKLPDIPEDLYKDFILGFYDGDGIASVGKSHYMGFVGTKEFLENIAKQIKKDTGLPEPNVNYNRHNDMYYLTYNTKQSQIKLWNYFYKETTYPVLVRKKDKIRKVLGI